MPCTPDCPCHGQPTERPRVCPLDGHVFRGSGWDGIDAHYRAKHEEGGESYEVWWQRICQDHRS